MKPLALLVGLVVGSAVTLAVVSSHQPTGIRQGERRMGAGQRVVPKQLGELPRDLTWTELQDGGRSVRPSPKAYTQQDRVRRSVIGGELSFRAKSARHELLYLDAEEAALWSRLLEVRSAIRELRPRTPDVQPSKPPPTPAPKLPEVIRGSGSFRY